MNKPELFAKAITQTMMEKDYSNVIFGSERLPRGFWPNVQKHLTPGVDWPAHVRSLSVYYQRHKPQVIALLSIPLQTERTERAEPTLQADPMTMPDIEKMIEKAIDKRFLHYQQNEQHEQNEQMDIELIPEPGVLKGGRPGRRLTRDYVKKTITVDLTLSELFDTECKRRRIPASRLLDSILWNHYGRPAIVSKV